MIHLERFNLFKKKEKEESLYKKTNYNDLQSFFVSHKEETIDKHDFDALSNISKDIRKTILNRIMDSGEDYGVRFVHKYKYCELLKFEDEWFILKTISERNEWRPQGITRYFLCDTLEGVIQALKENK